ncbi:MAG: hypothetical protein K5751_09685 [Treponemataceae bacterium]|nr:hypothetical protein [Treponemataceae bacterium]
MKKIVKCVLILIFLFFVSSFVVAETFSYSQLLSGYCNSDIQLEELSLSLSQSELSLHKLLLDDDMSWTLSTGSTSIGVDGSGLDFSTSPSLSLTFPTASNTKVKISSPISLNQTDSSVKFSLNGASIDVSTDFVNPKDETAAISREKAERSVLEAERKVSAREISVEKAFLNELKTLYNGKLSVYEAEQSLFSAQSSLDVLVAQGYEKTSLKYKKADMSLQSAQHKYDQAVYSYNSNLTLFCNKCGISVPEDFSVDLPDVKLANISDYPKESYSAIESASWNSYMNERNRSTSSDFSLSSNEGVSFTTSSGSNVNTKFSTTLSAGVSTVIKDVTASASLEIPINSEKKPSLRMSLTWSPSNKELNTVTELSNANAIKQEEFNKREAESKYEDDVATYNSKRDNILWEYDRNVEELKMYSEYFDEIEKWYKQGLVNRSEYQQAQNSYEDAYYAVAVSKIDKLIYNLDVKSLFVNN